MPNLNQSQLIDRLTTSQKNIIALPQNPLLDHVASALALTLGLKNLGKQVTLLGDPNLNWHLPAEAEIQPDVRGRNLIISWPDPHNAVTQVTTESQRDTGRFAIIVQTNPQFEPLNSNQIDFAYSGIDTDLVLLISTSSDSIKNSELSQLLTRTKNLGIRLATTEKLPDESFQDYFQPQAPAMAILVWQILTALKVKINPDIATLLLTGLEHRTERFANPNLHPDVFVMVAACLQAGGSRDPNVTLKPHQVSLPDKSSALAPKAPPTQTSPRQSPTPNWIKPVTIDQAASATKPLK